MSTAPAPKALEFFSLLSRLLPERRTQHETLLGPLQVVMSLIYMTVLGAKGYARVLDQMKRELGEKLGWGDRVPTKAALSQARKSFDEEQIRAVFHAVARECKTAARRPSLRFGRFRVVCFDGTTVALPSHPALRRSFRCPGNKHGPAPAPQAGLTVLWDPGRRLPIDFRTTCQQPNERDDLIEMLPGLGSGDMVLVDRGGASWRVFSSLHERDIEYLFRLQRRWSREVDEFAASDANELILQWELRDTADRPTGRMAFMRLLKMANPNHGQPPLVFATSLTDMRQYPAEELLKLYTHRWNIETAFREMKVWHGLEHLHARSEVGIRQEITAIMIFLLCAGELEAMVRESYADQLGDISPTSDRERHPGEAPAPTHVREWPVRFNRLLLSDIVIQILTDCIAGDTARAVRTFRDGIAYLWRNRTKPKAGRSYPRRPKSPLAKRSQSMRPAKDA